MRISSTFFLLIMTTITASAQSGTAFKLPQKWEKDFVITLSYHGSMSGGSTDIVFTYDSCKYKSSSPDKEPKEKVYLLKAADRMAIMKKLHELKVDQIKSESTVHAVNDGWSQSICFGFHCIEGGTSAEMKEHDKNQFLISYRYLEEFAMKKI